MINFAIIFGIMTEMVKLLERHKPPKLIKEEVEIMNITVSIKEVESMGKNFPKRALKIHVSLLVKSIKHFKMK
jgi:hypothetical protein